jgi:hypothetical protein
MHHDHAPSEASARERGSNAPEVSGLPLLYCPECGMPAWVEWRDGGGRDEVAHVKVRCFARHWFLMPQKGLTAS